MEEIRQKHFNSGIEALEDAYSLADRSVYPVLDNLFYQFSSLNSSQNLIHKHTSNISRFLKSGFGKIISEYFVKRMDCPQFNLIWENDDFDFMTWDRILDVLPQFLAVVSAFKFSQKVTLIVGKEGIKLRGKIGYDESLGDKREKIYSMYRKLFAKNAMLTFDVNRQEHETKMDLTLNLILDTFTGKAFCIQLPEKNLTLGFPAIFSNFSRDIEERVLISDHTCIEITEDLNVRRYSSIPKDLITSNHHEIIYFPFIFRPLSFIIPGMGKLLPIRLQHGRCVLFEQTPFSAKGSTGSGTTSQEQGQQEDQFHYVDFFGLIST